MISASHVATMATDSCWRLASITRELSSLPVSLYSTTQQSVSFLLLYSQSVSIHPTYWTWGVWYGLHNMLPWKQLARSHTGTIYGLLTIFWLFIARVPQLFPTQGGLHPLPLSFISQSVYSLCLQHRVDCATLNHHGNRTSNIFTAWTWDQLLQTSLHLVYAYILLTIAFQYLYIDTRIIFHTW